MAQVHLPSAGAVMIFEIADPIRDRKWNDLVLATDDYSVFHSSGWAETLHRSYAYTPFYFVLRDGDRLLGLIPVMEVKSFLTGKRGVSLTFTDYCEPIAHDPEIFHILLQRVIEHGRKAGWAHIEFRGGQKFLPHAPVQATYIGHTLALCSDEAQLLARFRSSTRRNITKSTLEGVETRMDTGLRAVDDYYRLHCLTRKRHGLPPQPFHFFRNVHDCIIARGHGFTALAYHRGQLIAGAMFFHFGNRALYKYGASDDSWQHLRANNLLMWEAIRWYGQNGYATFCFGRTDCNHTGLRQFKNGWGTKEKIIHYYRYDLGTGQYLANNGRGKSAAAQILEKTPHHILKVIGQFLYKHMG